MLHSRSQKEEEPMRPTVRLCVALPFLVAACAPKGETAVKDSAATATAPVVDPAAVRAAIEQQNARMTDALQKADTAAIGSLYADDAVVMMAGQPAWNGKAEMMRNGTAMLNEVKFSDMKLTTASVDVAGDYAIETGTVQMTLTPKGGKPMPDKGKYVTVWKKQADGSWKIYRDISNSDNPPPKK
jgi:uncharacterized protein (TIGR02246 family)